MTTKTHRFTPGNRHPSSSTHVTAGGVRASCLRKPIAGIGSSSVPEPRRCVVRRPPDDEKKPNKSCQQRQPFNRVDDDNKKKLLKGKSPPFDREAKKSAQPSKFLCGICFDDKPASDKFKEGKCNHSFCTHCISKHVAAQIHQNILKVTCPNPNCSVEFKPQSLSTILPREVVDRWESSICESFIVGSEKTYCPFKDCSVLLVSDGEKVVITSAECPSCHRLFCAQCKVPWHGSMICEQFQETERNKDEKVLDNKFFNLAKEENWQKCPQCTMFVQRREGCEHMTCRCGCNFCYICGENWKSGHLCMKRPST